MKKCSKFISILLCALMLMQMPIGVMADNDAPYFDVTVTNTITGQAGGYVEIDNFIDYVPDEAKFSLNYLSDAYGEYIYEPAVFTYTKDGTTQVYMQQERPLTNVVLAANGDAESAKLTVPVPTGYSGEYDVKFYLTVAQAKECDDVKPMHGSLTLNVSGTAAEQSVEIKEAILNDNEIEFYKNYGDLPPRAYIQNLNMSTEQFGSSYVMNLTVAPTGEIPGILAWQEDGTNFVTVSPYAFYAPEGEEPPFGYGKYKYFLSIVDENGEEYTSVLTVNFKNEDLVAEDMILLSQAWNYIEDGTDAFYAYDYNSRAIYYYDEGAGEQKLAIIDEEDVDIIYPMLDELLSGTSDGTGFFIDGFVDGLLYSAAILKDANGDNKYENPKFACIQKEGVVKSVEGNIATTVNDEEIDVTDCELVGVGAAADIKAGDVISVGYEMPSDTKKAWISTKTFDCEITEIVTGDNEYITDGEKTYYVTDSTISQVTFEKPCEGKLSYFGTALDLVSKQSDDADDDDSETPVVPPKYKLTFKVNGEEYASYDLEAGETIPTVDAPRVNNYKFEGWENLPTVMPSQDTIINAIMKPTSTVHGIVKFNDEVAESAIVAINGQSYTTENDGTFWFTDVYYGDYMVTAEKNGMKTTVAVTVSSSDTNLGEVVLEAKGTDVKINDTSIKKIDGLDAVVDSVITAEDEIYLETPGNTINVVATSNSVISSEAIAAEISSKYSGYTSTGVYIDINLAKVKGGTETTSTLITETSSLVEFKVEIPQTLKDKDKIIVLREHNGTVDVIETIANSNGEYIVRTGNYLTLYLNRFSVYSFAGKDIYTGGGGGSVLYTVKFDTNGAEAIKSQSIKKNRTVTKPADPTKEGYAFEGWYQDKELTKAYDFATEVKKSFTLYAKWAELKNDETENPNAGDEEFFTDVKTTDWFYASVKYVSQNNLMNGVSETAFAPDNALTRAMLVTVLYRAEGEPATNRSIPFADIEMGSWYANAVIWAQQNGIINGVSETQFSPNDNITREQIAAIMYRYANLKGMDAVTLEENLHYADANEISEYAVSAMNWAVGTGLMKGKSTTTINPKDNATRAEIAAILQRFMEANK